MTILLALVLAQTLPLTSPKGIVLTDVKPEFVDYKGRKALHVIETTGKGEHFAMIEGSDFQDGTIEVDLVGQPRKGADESARGFIGIGFRIDENRGEVLYLRPTNARADDQLRRNHSTQYVSIPDWPWQRLRKESPGVYESWVDMEPGAWTHMKVEVSGSKARLYVNGSTQPALIVNDLKLGSRRGKVALWVGPDTDACFSKLKIGR
jgi:hypothetical protein